jgi:hypothetical protein
MRCRSFAVALSISIAVAPALATAQRPDLAAFDAYVTRAVKAWDVPGLAIAVVSGDSVLFAKGYGVRSLGRPEPVDAHTRFSIGSTTKAMTALALLMAADSGAVALDAPVQRYLPALQLYDPVMTREMTVRDLLTHHTGLPGSDQLWYGTDASTDEIIRRMRWLQPATSFRNSYAYQNVQYAMAGEVLRRDRSRVERCPAHTHLGCFGARDAAHAASTVGPEKVIDDTLRVIENRSVDGGRRIGLVQRIGHGALDAFRARLGARERATLDVRAPVRRLVRAAIDRPPRRLLPGRAARRSAPGHLRPGMVSPQLRRRRGGDAYRQHRRHERDHRAAARAPCGRVCAGQS